MVLVVVDCSHPHIAWSDTDNFLYWFERTYTQCSFHIASELEFTAMSSATKAWFPCDRCGYSFFFNKNKLNKNIEAEIEIYLELFFLSKY